MKKHGKGAIVNLGSISAVTAQPEFRVQRYQSSHYSDDTEYGSRFCTLQHSG